MLNPKIGFVQSGQLFLYSAISSFYVFRFSIDINVDKISVRITVDSSWLTYLLNLGSGHLHGRRPGAEFGGEQKIFSQPNFRKNVHFQGKHF